MLTEEKRKFSRIPLNFNLTVTLDDGSVHVVEKVQDISIGGCLLPAVTEYEGHENCTITIKLGDPDIPDGPKVVTRGKIVRKNEDTVAVQFIAIDPDSLFHLKNMIRFNAPDPDRIDEEILSTRGLK